MTVEIPNAEMEEWLSAIKPYQRNVILHFLKELPPEEAAEKWLGSTGSPNTIPFGGTQDTKPFWNSFKAEFTRFLCDDTAYFNDKKELFAQKKASREVLVGAISAAIGAAVGYSSILLAPAVAILLCTAGKIGVVAYCKSQKG